MHGIPDIAAIQICLHRDFYQRLRDNLHRLAGLDLLHGLIQKAAVHLKAHAGNVPVLLGTQKVTGTPDFQVTHGNLEACPQLCKFLDGLQALFRHLAENLVLLIQQVGIGKVIGTPHPAPHLVELRQAKSIRIINNNRVGVGNIQPAFDNAGSQQNIVLALVELHHDTLQLCLRHLAVGNLNHCIRHDFLQLQLHLLNGFHPVVDKINLSPPLQLPVDGVPDDAVAVFHNVGLHREAFLRRRADNAHIPRPCQGHVQGTGYRSGTEGEHIYADGKALDFFLLLDAETLFLIYNQKPQILELHLFLVQQGMGADEDIHPSFPGLLQDCLLLLGAAEAVEYIHRRTEISESFLKGLIMLLCQYGGRHQHCHLLASHDRLEGCPDGNLRLAEAHITAEQPVHRLLSLHIPLNIIDGRKLVGGFLKGKCVLKLILPHGIRPEGKSLGFLPLGVQPD